MLDYENIYEYLKRFSTVEPIYGILKTFYHIEDMLTRGKLKNGNKLNLCAGSFNIKRLYKLIKELSLTWIDFNGYLKQIHEQTAKYMNEIEKAKVKTHYPMII